jgi:hypothetical protein
MGLRRAFLCDFIFREQGIFEVNGNDGMNGTNGALGTAQVQSFRITFARQPRLFPQVLQ